MKKENPTVADVAKKAGVSTATVSRVINAKDKVSDKTKTAVLNAIKELDFIIKQDTDLYDQDSKTILVFVTELRNPFFVPVLDGIQNSSYKHGYDLLILQTKELYKEFSDYESVLKSQRFAGVIFLSSITSNQLKIITQKLNYRLPIVLCSEYIHDMDIPYVCIDDVASMKKATKYALSIGSRNIAFLNASLNQSYARRREAGFRDAMAEYKIEVNEDYIIHLSSVSYNLAYTNSMHLLKQKTPPDTIICVSDVFAAAAINAAKKLGLRVPEDVAVIGFDNIDLSTMISPTLTTIDQPTYLLGYQSCELLMEKIYKPNTPNKQLYLETELIIRESTPMVVKKETL
ncbi:MAG: LacI family transcriptional regulator [Erysipelothrix sp.]|nr:LacI family transcriptional regulator [Erysipelothrix sp.]